MRLRQHGLTLVEIMVALTVGLIITAGLLQIFLSSKTTYRVQEGLSRLQENGRFAIDIMSRDIRMAGYTGCATGTQIANTLNGGATNWWVDLSTPLRGYEGGVDTFPAEFAGDVVAGRDVIVVLRGDGDAGGFPVQSHNPTAASIHLASNHDIKQGEVLVISDCINTAIFQMSNTNNNNTISVVDHNTGNGVTPGNCTKGLGVPVVCTANGTPYTYGPNATLMRFSAHAYYIGTGQSGQPSLFRERMFRTSSSSLNTSAEELLEGVEDMQILYGFDTDNDGWANRYVTANNVGAGNWDNVVSVRLALLTATVEEMNPTAQPYTFPTYANASPGDRRLRREFSTTIAIRNRLP